MGLFITTSLSDIIEFIKILPKIIWTFNINLKSLKLILNY